HTRADNGMEVYALEFRRCNDFNKLDTRFLSCVLLNSPPKVPLQTAICRVQEACSQCLVRHKSMKSARACRPRSPSSKSSTSDCPTSSPRRGPNSPSYKKLPRF